LSHRRFPFPVQSCRQPTPVHRAYPCAHRSPLRQPKQIKK
jgi:hypothetical protein